MRKPDKSLARCSPHSVLASIVQIDPIHLNFNASERDVLRVVGELERIAAVDGVDALFVGPGDISASLGVIGQFTHPKVMELLADAAQRAKATRKPIGTIGDSPEVAAQYRAAGFDFIAIGSDVSLLMRAARSVIGALRTPDSEHVHSISSGTQGY